MSPTTVDDAAGDALGVDNGALTVDAYWAASLVGGVAVRAETPGSIRSLLDGRRALTCPGSLWPRVAIY
jgi:hypothetical protein